MEENDEYIHMESSATIERCLSDEEMRKLSAQTSRFVTEFQAKQFEKNAQRHWDLFFKRNETKFFRNRRWTTREFKDLLNEPDDKRKNLFEVGCGVGNMIFPLIEEKHNNYFYYACDFSHRAIGFVKGNCLYDPEKMTVFHCDITTDMCFDHIAKGTIDIVTLIFVLSAIHPDNFSKVIQNLHKLLRPGGVVLFRDYGLYDMAQIRFKPGHKISPTKNFYVRQDGTRSYFFSQSEISQLFTSNGFDVKENSYIHRRTVNAKENIDVPRIFVQGKFEKC